MTEATLNIKEFFIKLERVVDEEAALEMWRQYVLAHGWSRVGEPEVVRHDDGRNREGQPFVIGKLVRTNKSATLNPDMSGPLRWVAGE